MQLIVATRNAHKTREIQRILGAAFAVSDLSPHPEVPQIYENGRSFEENATLKALPASRYLPGFIVADDSGLEVDALGGAPGILSARYAGQNASDKQNIDKLLGELVRAGATGSNRSARFRCVIALARQDELVATFDGVVEGIIADVPRGQRGFGYDPIFVPRGFKETFAELPEEVKNRISHRAKAIRALATKIAAFNRSD
jgi:XTP/dITP diphosphohydrolase